jgi:hypothetical protein
LKARAFLRNARARCWRAGMSASWISVAAARCMAEGNTSLDDCEALTSSLGCTRVPSRSLARVARTSFMFMLVDVPEPVWKTSRGNSWSQWPAATS